MKPSTLTLNHLLVFPKSKSLGSGLLVAAGVVFFCIQSLSFAGSAEPAGNKKPEIVVQQPSGSNLKDGAAKRSFGTVVLGKTGNAKTFKIKNTGNAKLTGLRVTKVGLNVADFSVGVLKVASLVPGENTVFNVKFIPTAKGTRKATLRISSNDANENPFDIIVTGEAVK